MIGYLYLSLAVIATAFGQILLKKHHLMDNVKVSANFIIAIFLFICVPFLIYLSLLHINFTIVFLSDALSISLVVLLSNFILKERMNLKKTMGIAMIVVGIFIIGWRLG